MEDHLKQRSRFLINQVTKLSIKIPFQRSKIHHRRRRKSHHQRRIVKEVRSQKADCDYPFFLLYGLRFVGFRLMLLSEAILYIEFAVLPTFNPITLVGVF